MSQLQPLTFAAGGGVLGLLFILARVLLRYVTSQGDSWQTLLHEAQADATAARAEVSLVRAELVSVRAEVAMVHLENVALRRQIGGVP